jgi:chromosomal replication initiation ATPase DnaA
LTFLASLVIFVYVTSVENRLSKPTNLKALRRSIENEPRDVAISLIRSMRAEPLMRVGTKFGLARYSSLSSAVIRVKAKLQKDRKFKNRLQHIESNILKGQT